VNIDHGDGGGVHRPAIGRRGGAGAFLSALDSGLEFSRCPGVAWRLKMREWSLKSRGRSMKCLVKTGVQGGALMAEKKKLSHQRRHAGVVHHGCA
jgi:hypothetical protein